MSWLIANHYLAAQYIDLVQDALVVYKMLEQARDIGWQAATACPVEKD